MEDESQHLLAKWGFLSYLDKMLCNMEVDRKDYVDVQMSLRGMPARKTMEVPIILVEWALRQVGKTVH